MEDFIPLLIIIVISIVGAIGKKKQKNQPVNTENTQQTREPDEIFRWLDQLTEKQQIEQEPQTAQAQEIVEPKSQSDIKDSYNSGSVKDKINNQYSAFSGIISNKEREELLNKEGQSFVKENKKPEVKRSKFRKHQSMTKNFNLREAIVYSEILNRKYI